MHPKLFYYITTCIRKRQMVMLQYCKQFYAEIHVVNAEFTQHKIPKVVKCIIFVAVNEARLALRIFWA